MPDNKYHILVEYQHKHGTSFVLCDSWETAGKAAESIAAEWRGEWEISEDLTDKQCVDDWGGLTGWSEFINIHEMALTTMETYSYPQIIPSNLEYKET